MPIYEYFCGKCATKFEMLRPIGRGDEPATCAQGHNGGARVLSVFAAPPRGGAEPATGGGCACGGGACGCAH